MELTYFDKEKVKASSNDMKGKDESTIENFENNVKEQMQDNAEPEEHPSEVAMLSDESSSSSYGDSPLY